MLQRPCAPEVGDVAGNAPLGRPQVVAHRGASEKRAEHTREAYELALEAGAEALECDVRLTADGHLVCVHDRRADRTSDGRGPISTLPLGELESLDFASWKQPWADLDDESLELPSVAVLTFDALCSLAHDWGSGVQLAVETKHPTRYAGLVERRLVDALARFGWTHREGNEPARVRVMSFARLSLRRLRQLAPDVPRVFLMDRVPWHLHNGRLPVCTPIAGPRIDALRADPAYVERAHAAGHPVHVWVVNADDDLKLCQQLGVDAVITDRPEHARQLFEI